MNDLAIREFVFPDDYNTVIALWDGAGSGVHTGRSDRPEEIAKKLTRDPDLFLLAVVDGEIVGTVLGGFDGRRGLIYHLAVKAAYRKRGIGDRLMAEIERRLALKGCLRCYLLVTPENESAMHFYELHGWERMPTITFGKNLVYPPS
jgi:ribosomal protein S18 acetylase RimI-like enzyme